MVDTHLEPLILNVNFGSHDGEEDENLFNYFLDDEYIDKIVNGPIYFVIGRKGTGKTALCSWIKYKESEIGYLCSNLSFRDFPTNQLLALNDEKYPLTSQYSNIWEYMILCEFARLIIKDNNAAENEYLQELKDYLREAFGDGIFDLHKRTVQKTEKNNAGLKVPNFTFNNEDQIQISYNLENNIELVNRRLKEVIERYLICYVTDRKVNFIIQFDGLDDNYAVLEQDKYFNAIISLFKCAYSLNNLFKRGNLPAKVLVYLRSDIYNSIAQVDSDSAKWDPKKHELRWAVIYRDDYVKGPLRKMINLRIKNSINSSHEDYWSVIFNNDDINLRRANSDAVIDVFQYIVNNTMHRPRDLVMFCIEIQKETKRRGKLDYRTIKNAHREFANWFWREIVNEINK